MHLKYLEPVAGALLMVLFLADVFLTVLYARVGTGIVSDVVARSVFDRGNRGRCGISSRGWDRKEISTPPTRRSWNLEVSSPVSRNRTTSTLCFSTSASPSRSIPFR
jgi:hypothetical protein